MIAQLRTTIVFIFFLSFSSACCQSTSRNGNVIVFDSAKTDISTYRKEFLKNLPAPSRYVNDYENVFSENEERVLDSLIAAFEAATTIEIALVTLDSTATERDNFDDLTLQIAKQWGVGKKETDNGVLIGVSIGHRKMRIQNGYGIEKILSDSETKEITDNYFIPDIKSGKLYSGTLKGLNQLMRILSTRANYKKT
jgi:uncharacterized protein